jgi:repressor LexA
MGEDKLSLKARTALRHIRNAVMHFGRVPSVRELMVTMDYKSPRSAMLLMQELEDNGFLKRKSEGTYQFIKDLEAGNIIRTVSVPLVGSVPCGVPLLAEENLEAMIEVSDSLARPGSKYFLLRAMGDSMNAADINEGDLLLIKQQSVVDYNGQNVVALINDEATVKEFHQVGGIVTLMPRSKNPVHKQIILTTDFQIQGIVAATIPKNELYE